MNPNILNLGNVESTKTKPNNFTIEMKIPFLNQIYIPQSVKHSIKKNGQNILTQRFAEFQRKSTNTRGIKRMPRNSQKFNNTNQTIMEKKSYLDNLFNERPNAKKIIIPRPNTTHGNLKIKSNIKTPKWSILNNTVAQPISVNININNNFAASQIKSRSRSKSKNETSTFVKKSNNQKLLNEMGNRQHMIGISKLIYENDTDPNNKLNSKQPPKIEWKTSAKPSVQGTQRKLYSKSIVTPKVQTQRLLFLCEKKSKINKLLNATIDSLITKQSPIKPKILNNVQIKRENNNVKTPLNGMQAIKQYSDELNEYEKNEILDYKEVYYIQKNKNISEKFDNDKGEYKAYVGNQLGYRYEIIDIFGKGSFGQVLKCIDHKIDETVAVKVINSKEKFYKQAMIEIKIDRKSVV